MAGERTAGIEAPSPAPSALEGVSRQWRERGGGGGGGSEAPSPAPQALGESVGLREGSGGREDGRD